VHQRLDPVADAPGHPAGPPAASQLLIETMEAMKLTDPNPHLDVAALRKGLQAAA